MRNNLIFILFLIFTSTIISCGQLSKNKIDLTIDDNELGLVITKNKRVVLGLGGHRIDKDSKVILFNTIASLTMEDFDILDSNAKSLYCQIQIKYALNSDHIKNIADLLEYKHSIESYEILLIAPEIKSEIRNITGNYLAVDLIKKDFKDKVQMEKYISEKLDKYIDLMSLDLNIYEKQ